MGRVDSNNEILKYMIGNMYKDGYGRGAALTDAVSLFSINSSRGYNVMSAFKISEGYKA